MQASAPAAAWSYRPSIIRITTPLMFLATLYALWFGWQSRGHSWFVPEEGVGYWLGIFGGTMMLLLALYPLRKRLRGMAGWGAIRHWFRLHMLFGVVGPLAILYHCNFQTGAVNSNVALLCMLVVAASGLIGRYLYAHIHQGLYGSEVSLDELRKKWGEKMACAQDHGLELSAIENKLARYEAPCHLQVMSSFGALLKSSFALWMWPWMVMRVRRQLHRLPDVAEAEKRALGLLLKERIRAAARVHRHIAFQRMFALWHLLHLPLFAMLVVTGIVHVVAVHMY